MQVKLILVFKNIFIQQKIRYQDGRSRRDKKLKSKDRQFLHPEPKIPIIKKLDYRICAAFVSATEMQTEFVK
jgi:hypothetical protein